jgi:recombination associated protein RdgC
MWINNAQVYRLPKRYALTSAQLIEALTPQTFAPCSSNEAERAGWVPPRPGGELVHVVHGQMILKLCVQKKVLPGAVVNKELRARCAQLEEQQGFPPGKKATKELKERVTDELLAKAFAKDDFTMVWIDCTNGWLVIDAASATKADAVIKLLLKAVDRMPLESLRVQKSPVAVMTGWLESDEAPHGFTVDQDVTLRASGTSDATVTYKRHSLDPEDMRRHIANGKQCVRLALTWNSRVSFVLDESLAVKRIQPLDVIKENTAVTYSDDERYDNDIMLMTGEMAKLLDGLVEALGGFAVDGVDVGQQSALPSSAHEAARQLHQTVAQAGATATLTFGNRSVTFGAQDGENEQDDDALYEQAVAVVRANQRASISLVQRHLRIGYNRAARLLEEMERKGVVSPMESNGNRTLLQTTNDQSEAA